MANGQYDVIAAVLAGGIVPPYVTALATTIFRRKFTEKQRQAGLTNYIIGLAGITEAAIPFWGADPVGIIISCVAGSGTAGALSMVFGCSVMAPFGSLHFPAELQHCGLYLLDFDWHYRGHHHLRSHRQELQQGKISQRSKSRTGLDTRPRRQAEDLLPGPEGF